MDEAVDVLNLCGINGPVTFAIQTGNLLSKHYHRIYKWEQSNQSITFTSSTTGDSSDVVLHALDDATSSGTHYDYQWRKYVYLKI
jgi:hypothetical protein